MRKCEERKGVHPMLRRLPGGLALVLSPLICGLVIALAMPVVDGGSAESFLAAFALGAALGLAPGFLIWYSDRLARRLHDKRGRSRPSEHSSDSANSATRPP